MTVIGQKFDAIWPRQEARKMAELGGKTLAADLKTRLPDLRKKAEALRLRAAAAVTGFTTEANNVEQAVKSIEDETAEMAQIANEILGNVEPRS